MSKIERQVYVGKTRSFKIETEAIEVESGSDRGKEYMAGLQTMTIVFDIETDLPIEHWEEIERRRVDKDERL